MPASSSSSSKNRSKLCPAVSFSEVSYEVSIYSITGSYFCIKKEYGHADLEKWASSLGNKAPTINKPRLSVAENLAKQNVLKELRDKKIS